MWYGIMEERNAILECDRLELVFRHESVQISRGGSSQEGLEYF